jgi:hypothetical protein
MQTNFALASKAVIGSSGGLSGIECLFTASILPSILRFAGPAQLVNWPNASPLARNSAEKLKIAERKRRRNLGR